MLNIKLLYVQTIVNGVFLVYQEKLCWQRMMADFKVDRIFKSLTKPVFEGTLNTILSRLGKRRGFSSKNLINYFISYLLPNDNVVKIVVKKVVSFRSQQSPAALWISIGVLHFIWKSRKQPLLCSCLHSYFSEDPGISFKIDSIEEVLIFWGSQKTNDILAIDII